MKLKGLFITGTDTGVGKTTIATKLARQLYELDKVVVPRKPVESGCEYENEQLIPKDALALKNAANYDGMLSDVCPFRFSYCTSPRRAAHLAHEALTTQKLYETCLPRSEYDVLLVEGAGGFYSPLSEEGLNADLAEKLGLPVLLVAPDKLGTISNVLLNAEAIKNRGLFLSGVILNKIDDEVYEHLNNFDDLKELLDCPVYYRAYNSKEKLPDALINNVLQLDLKITA